MGMPLIMIKPPWGILPFRHIDRGSIKEHCLNSLVTFPLTVGSPSNTVTVISMDRFHVLRSPLRSHLARTEERRLEFGQHGHRCSVPERADGARWRSVGVPLRVGHDPQGETR